MKPTENRFICRLTQWLFEPGIGWLRVIRVWGFGNYLAYNGQHLRVERPFWVALKRVWYAIFPTMSANYKTIGGPDRKRACVNATADEKREPNVAVARWLGRQGAKLRSWIKAGRVAIFIAALLFAFGMMAQGTWYESYRPSAMVVWNQNPETNVLGYAVWHRMEPSTQMWTRINVGYHTNKWVNFNIGTNMYIVTAYDEVGDSLPGGPVYVIYKGGPMLTNVVRLVLQYSTNLTSWVSMASLGITNRTTNFALWRGFMEIK